MAITDRADLRSYLEEKSEYFRRQRSPRPGYKYCSIEEFVLVNGREMELSEEKVNLGGSQQSFANAFALASSRHDLTYCEGYGLDVIPVLHAWCIDSKNRVVDPTWINPQAKYFGVPFELGFVSRSILAQRSYGILGDWQRTLPLLKGELDEGIVKSHN